MKKTQLLKIQETLYIGQGCLSPLQSRHLGTSHSSPNCHQLPHRICLNLIHGLKISSLSKVILVLGKARSHRAPNLGYSGPESPGWFEVSLKTAWDVGALSWWSCQSPVAHSWGLLNHPNTFHRRMFKLNAKFDADLLFYSLSHFECNSHTVHMLTQWHQLSPLTSTVKLSLFTHAHSSPLSFAASLHQCCVNHSHYINSGWTVSGQMSFISDPYTHKHMDKIIVFTRKLIL